MIYVLKEVDCEYSEILLASSNILAIENIYKIVLCKNTGTANFEIEVWNDGSAIEVLSTPVAIDKYFDEQRKSNVRKEYKQPSKLTVESITDDLRDIIRSKNLTSSDSIRISVEEYNILARQVNMPVNHVLTFDGIELVTD
jgi:hypothetical protein